jgi:hypothetical protein
MRFIPSENALRALSAAKLSAYAARKRGLFPAARKHRKILQKF